MIAMKHLYLNKNVDEVIEQFANQVKKRQNKFIQTFIIILFFQQQTILMNHYLNFKPIPFPLVFCIRRIGAPRGNKQSAVSLPKSF